MHSLELSERELGCLQRLVCHGFHVDDAITRAALYDKVNSLFIAAKKEKATTIDHEATAHGEPKGSAASVPKKAVSRKQRAGASTK